MAKIGPKEAAQRDLQAKKLSRAHEMMLEDGCPPKCIRTGPGPKIKRRDDERSAGVTLAPPIAVQKAIAADLAGSTEEERILDAVENAHHFTCTIFRGHNGYQTARFDTLAEARAYKPTLEAEAANHRKAMVYAVTNTGMTHFVPDDFIYPTKDRPPLAANKEDTTMAKATTKTTKRAKTKTKPAKSATRRKVQSTAARKPSVGRYDWAKAAEDAKTGKIPSVPDFSARTHDGYRKRFDTVVALAKAGDLAGLKKDDTKPISGSRKIICRYRDAAITALSAK